VHTSDPLDFRFFGDGFDLNGFDNDLSTLEAEFGPFRTCCHLGQPVDLSARVSQELGNGQNVRFNGVTYSEVFWGGELRFDAPSVTMPGEFSQTPLVSPFTLSGTLIAFATPALTGTPLFSADLVGSGLASVGFTPSPGAMGDLDYTISAVAPTPEPASLLLLGSGVAIAGVRRWRNRRQS
jgi:hypothetical protein